LGRKGCGTSLALGTDEDQNDPVPSCSMVPVPSMLLVGPSLEHYWSQSRVLTCSLRSESIPVRPALSGQDLGTKGCGTASVLGADGDRKALVLL